MVFLNSSTVSIRMKTMSPESRKKRETWSHSLMAVFLMVNGIRAQINDTVEVIQSQPTATIVTGYDTPPHMKQIDMLVETESIEYRTKHIKVEDVDSVDYGKYPEFFGRLRRGEAP